MEWFCVLKKGISIDGLNNDQLYKYKVSRDYDQMFTVFNGKNWIECDVEKFDLLIYHK